MVSCGLQRTHLGVDNGPNSGAHGSQGAEAFGRRRVRVHVQQLGQGSHYGVNVRVSAGRRLYQHSKQHA